MATKTVLLTSGTSWTVPADLDTSGLKETIMGGLATLFGGLAASAAGGLGKKLLGGLMGGGGEGEGGGANPIKDAAVGGAAAGAEALVPGSGEVVENLAGQVESLESPINKAMTLGQKIRDFGAGIGGFLKEVGVGVGQAIKGVLTGLGAGVSSLGMSLATSTPLGPAGIAVAAFFLALAGALRLAAPAFEAMAPVLIKLADVLGNVLITAIKEAGPIIEKIFNGIATVIKSVGEAISGIINSITDSISRLAGLNPAQMLAVAAGITAMAAAVAIFGGASTVGGFMSAVGDFFGGDPVEKFRKFQELDALALNAVAGSITALANSMANFSGEASANVASSLQNLGDSLSNSISAEEYRDWETDRKSTRLNSSH